MSVVGPVSRAYAFFAALFLLVNSGRINGGDPDTQADAAMHLILTGRFGAEALPLDWAAAMPDPNPFRGTYRPSGEHKLWIESPEGRHYQAHEPGNILVMAPAAWAGLQLVRVLGLGPSEASDAVIKGAIGLNHALLSAAGCALVFAAFLGILRPREAFAASVVFAVGTMQVVYSKTAFDVMGAGVACAAVLALLSWPLGRPEARLGGMRGLGIGLALSLLLLFRVSVFPFVLAAVLGISAAERRRTTAAYWALGILGVLPGLAFDLYYNDIRTGSPFIPGTRVERYAEETRLEGDLLEGLMGLTVLPSRGVFPYNPILLLGLAWPWVRGRYPRGISTLVLGTIAAAAAYTLVVAKMLIWHGLIGWGPRYLLPILPLLYFPAGLGLVALWSRWKRPLAVLVGLSVAMNVIPALVNPGVVAFSFPGANQYVAIRPVQHIGAIKAIASSLTGRAYPSDPAFYFDGMDLHRARRETATFPDSWTLRLIRSDRFRAAGLVALATLVALLAASGYALGRSPRRGGPEGPSDGGGS